MTKLDQSGPVRRSRIDLDPTTNETITRELVGDERALYYYGENVGLLTFQMWFPSITLPGHQADMRTYDFPVRLKFVPEPFDAAPFHESSEERRGWNVPAWQRAALELQEQGVRAIVGGCGLTGNIQSAIQSVLEIPFYSSTMMFVPELFRAMPDGKKLAVLTVGEGFLRGHNEALFRECGIDPNWPIVYQGMYESDQVEKWLVMDNIHFDPALVEESMVTVASQMMDEHPDIGQFVFECTSMPPFTEAVRRATGVRVFDPVDMVKRVNAMVDS
ncbi:MAG: aspartate/glutamate racemase family protein [Lysobacterales bacterium]